MGEAKRKKKVPTDRPTEPKRAVEPPRGRHFFHKTKDGLACTRCGTQIIQTHRGWVKKLGTGACGLQIVNGGT